MKIKCYEKFGKFVVFLFLSAFPVLTQFVIAAGVTSTVSAMNQKLGKLVIASEAFLELPVKFQRAFVEKKFALETQNACEAQFDDL